jgi:hypothetical protein
MEQPLSIFEIKQATRNGKKVFVEGSAYQIVYNKNKADWFINAGNGHMIGAFYTSDGAEFPNFDIKTAVIIPNEPNEGVVITPPKEIKHVKITSFNKFDVKQFLDLYGNHIHKHENLTVNEKSDILQGIKNQRIFLNELS